MARTFLLSAVEPSADAMGADLMRALRGALPVPPRFVGCGGDAMRAEGLDSAFDVRALSVMGLGDAVRAVPAALAAAGRLAKIAREEAPEAAVLIDAWGFSRLAAPRIKRASPSTRLVKLAAPQVWASRPERAATAASLFDLILTLLPFEPPLFEAEGGRAAFVGNPNFQAVAKTPRSGDAFRARHGLGEERLLAVLPGSRRSEVERLMPTFGDAVDGVSKEVPGTRIVVVAAPAVEAEVRSACARWTNEALIVPAAERFDAFEAAEAALAASGTVTTELALCGVPMVVGYKVGRLTAAWARRILITDTVTILNIAAGERVVPERLQEDCTPEQLRADVVRLLTDDEARRRQLSAFRRVLPRLVGSGDAAARAAEEIVALLKREDGADLDASAQG
ncbi:lipid-A-disaccharide synthase [Parvularcula dongshanensis]|uniref:Lipid-A-disaccharide synthase n=1 Tax=Parvularcula dongshanensis TaxID=1173995 RepID=A0A840I529_9PROT|nr:lipid-A-disaccharide synthase [Parvularcula dongshanensis]MBB4659391.1 lipid-A-disaccharide synthase [Parvularcula dongshanensis]